MITSKNANNYAAQQQRGLKRKWELVQERGGKCEQCGYDKNLSAIEFHHRNPEEKLFQLDLRTLSNTKLETLRIEVDKCDMICSNCHREIHNERLKMDGIVALLEKHEGTKEINRLSFSTSTGNICPVCNTKFPKVTGKIYCSSECREKDKDYPTIEEINEQRKLLGSYEKVAQHFNLTRKIIDGIRNKNKNKNK